MGTELNSLLAGCVCALAEGEGGEGGGDGRGSGKTDYNGCLEVQMHVLFLDSLGVSLPF